MKSYNFGLTLVIFSILVSGCGSSKSMSAKAKQEASNKASTEAAAEVEGQSAGSQPATEPAAAPESDSASAPISEVQNPPPINDGGPRPPVTEQVSGQVACESAKDQTIDPTFPVELLTVTLTEKAQQIEFIARGADSRIVTNLGNVNFKVKRKIKIKADVIEVRNRTTCSQMQRSTHRDQVAAQALEVAESAPLNELRSIRVLPIGTVSFDSSENEGLTLDPLKPNYLDVQFKKCTDWDFDNQPPKCTKSEVVERQTVVVSIKPSGKYHRGFETKQVQ